MGEFVCNTFLILTSIYFETFGNTYFNNSFPVNIGFNGLNMYATPHM